MYVYYDLSRLMERADAHYPTGVDRVDLRYALWTRERASAWQGLIQRPDGLSVVDSGIAADLLSQLQKRWILAEAGVAGENAFEVLPEWRLETKLSILEKASRVSLRSRLQGRGMVQWPFYLYPRLSRWLLCLGRKAVAASQAVDPQGCYWNIGHNYRFEAAAEEIATRFGKRSVVFLHDVIPLLHPETQWAASCLHFSRFVEWLERLGGRVIVSSQSTIADIQKLKARGSTVFHASLDSFIQLPLPVEPAFVKEPSTPVQSFNPPHPYFLILGTWEPRKNFELLLDVWERLVAEGGSKVILRWVGRRGAMTSEAAGRLKRLKATGWVEELGAVPDPMILELFSGAQALLFPSLAEGWGLPLTEALAAGLPVIASDLPICREVSQGLAVYLDASRSEPWFHTIAQFVKADSATRAACLRVIGDFRFLTWEAYFDCSKLPEV